MERFLVGNNVYLRTVEKGDMELIKRWSNDPEIRQLTGAVTPMTEKGMEDFFAAIYNNDRLWFMVCLKQNDRPIGEAGLLRMFHPWRATDLSIILGEKDQWGKGYGSEAITLLMDYAFGYLNFHRIAIGVVSFNARALHFYKKVGFKEEGRQRDGYYYNNSYHDFIMMSILDTEFYQLQKKNQ